MSQVTLTIGPRSYSVNCADGEEDHIARLAQMIEEKYQLLGASRTPQEAQNLLFAALFLADELTDARKTAEKSSANVAHEKSRSGGKKADLLGEIETLTKAEARAREEVDALKAQLGEMRAAASHQHDMFGEGPAQDEFAETLEKLAERAEKIADSLDAPA